MVTLFFLFSEYQCFAIIRISTYEREAPYKEIMGKAFLPLKSTFGASRSFQIFRSVQINSMEITQVWNDQIPEKDGVKLSVNDIAFSPGFISLHVSNLLNLTLSC